MGVDPRAVGTQFVEKITRGLAERVLEQMLKLGCGGLERIDARSVCPRWLGCSAEDADLPGVLQARKEVLESGVILSPRRRADSIREIDKPLLVGPHPRKKINGIQAGLQCQEALFCSSACPRI